jgi:hypothetical protein
MTDSSIPSANVKQAVPFFWVTSMEDSLRFYVGGIAAIAITASSRFPSKRILRR